jgi:hypothetical protein
MSGASALCALRQQHRELTITHRRFGVLEIEGAVDTHATREPAEFPLDEMKRLR